MIPQEPLLLQPETQRERAEDVLFDLMTFLLTPSELTYMNLTSREHTHAIERQTRFFEPGEGALGQPDVWHEVVVLVADFKGLFHAWRCNSK